MKSWLTYIKAFAFAMGAVILCYLAGFMVLMSGFDVGITGFVLLVVFCPAMAGFITFGVSYATFVKQRFSCEDWLYGLVLIVVVTSFCSSLVVADILEEAKAALLWVVSLFIGGRMMIC